jgi:uncharacterized protein (TIGR02646 family)
MIKSSKASAPQKFITATKGANAVTDYDDLTADTKDSLRKSLCEEQGYLCCYCMQRIEPSISNMHIEHWQCQDNFPGRQLDYKNLLGACENSRGKKKASQYCAIKKDNGNLQFSPAEHDIETMIKYTPSGTIKSQHTIFNNQLNDTLNLNCASLRNDRKRTWDAFAVLNTSWTKDSIEQKILGYKTPDANGKLKEYSGIILFMLNKKLKRL